MTYCVGVLLNDGIVLASDSRTHAGVDNFATFCKMTVFERPGDRVIVLLSSGNLAGTQAVISVLKQRGDARESGVISVWNARTMFDVTVIVSDAVRDIERRDGKAATEADVDSFRRTYETNVFGVIAVTNAFLPALRRSAHPRIVNVSSGTGSLTWSTGPNPQFPHETRGSGAAYRSSKTALNALTVYYAQALAADGFKVNALAPGLRATNLNARAAASSGDPGEAAAGAVRLAMLPDDGPTGQFFSWDGTAVPW